MTKGKLISLRGRPIGLAHHAPLLGALIEHPAPIRITDPPEDSAPRHSLEATPRSPVSSEYRKRPWLGLRTSGMDDSSAVRGRSWTRVDGSFAPCPLSTSGPALGMTATFERDVHAIRLWSPR